MQSEALAWKSLFQRADGLHLLDHTGLSNRSMLEAFYFALKVGGRSPETLRTYRVHMTELVRYSLTVGRSFKDFKREDAQQWISTALDRMKVGSVNSYLRSFKSFFSFLTEEEYIPISPFRRVKLLPTEKKLKPTLTPEQVQKLIDSMPRHTYQGARNRAMTMVAYDCMLRVSEIMRLKVQNIRLDESVLEVEKSKSKTFRFVPISGATLRILHHFLYRHRDGVPGDILFPAQDGHKLGRGSFHLILRRAGETLNLHVHPHMLRRSGATGYVRNGGAIEMVKLILGHSSIRITEEYVQIADKETVAHHEEFSPAARLKSRAS